MMIAYLERSRDQTRQTTGMLHVVAEDGEDQRLRAIYMTIELPWKNNQKGISCIANGEYMLIPHYSPRFGKCLWVRNPQGGPELEGGRTQVLIHAANYYHQLRGCIAPGMHLEYIDADDLLDVKYSRSAITSLCDLIKEPSKFYISTR